MGFSQLPQSSREVFADAPEVAMDLQIGVSRRHRYVLVVGGRLTLEVDEQLVAQMRSYREFNSYEGPPTLGRTFAERLSPMEMWAATLPEEKDEIQPVPIREALTILGFLHLGPFGSLPSPPEVPAAIYGHLPFFGVASGNDVFYRYESYPTSLRIDQEAGRIIKPDTFASPPSELPFVPTGLAAVARYALPSLLPARWRWEIRPQAGTETKYGASVPLNGQSGGGVEVMFPKPFNNVGPIANPVVLPIF